MVKREIIVFDKARPSEAPTRVGVNYRKQAKGGAHPPRPPRSSSGPNRTN